MFILQCTDCAYKRITHRNSRSFAVADEKTPLEFCFISAQPAAFDVMCKATRPHRSSVF